MAMACRVRLLDDSEIKIVVEKKGTGGDLLDSVCEYLNLVDKDYFGLVFKDTKLQRQWIKPDKALRKQVPKNAKHEFQFLVKFYPSSPAKLKQEVTKYQVCLQIRQDLLAGNLPCPTDELANLSSYWLQSEFGDGEEGSREVKNYLSSLNYPSGDTPLPDFEEKVISLYRTRRGMMPVDADAQFLKTAASLPLYGVQFYEGKNRSKNDVKVGISSKGIVEKAASQPAIVHPWDRIKNIKYEKHKFKLKLLKAPQGGDPRQKKTFFFDSDEQVISMWKTAVEHHGFYRVGGGENRTPPESKKSSKKRKGSILRRFSSRKKKPKAEDDDGGFKGRPTTVERSSSLRRSASLMAGSSRDQGPSGRRPPKRSTSEPLRAAKGATGGTQPQDSEAVYAKVDKTKRAGDGAQAERDDNKDEDILNAVMGKMDTGSASGGSSTLLLTETIPEEDEEVPDSRPFTGGAKPVTYARLKDRDSPTRVSPTSSAFSRLFPVEPRQRRQVLETDLDAAALLNPELLQPGTTPKQPSHTVTIEDTETRREEVVEEVWEEVKPPRPAIRQDRPNVRKDVHFEDTVVSSEIQPTVVTPEEKVELDVKVPDDISESSKSSSVHSSKSLEEGEVQFNTQGEAQMQTLPEDNELKVQILPESSFDMPVNTNEEEELEEGIPALKEFHAQTVPKSSFGMLVDINREEELEEAAPTLREYIPTPRKDSSDEETEVDDHEGEMGHLERSLYTAAKNDVEPYDILETEPLQDIRDQHLDEHREEEMKKAHIDISNILTSPAEKSFPGPPQPPPQIVILKRKQEIPPAEEEDPRNLEEPEEDVLEEKDTETTEEESEKADEIFDRAHDEAIEDISTPLPVPSPSFVDNVEKTEGKYKRLSGAIHGLGVEGFTPGFDLEDYKSKPDDKFRDGAASTTAATLGDDNDLSLEDLDRDIMYEEEHPSMDEEDVTQDAVVQEEEVRPAIAKINLESFELPDRPSPEESMSCSTSLSELTDDTDELCRPNILEKTWSQGAGLDEDDELFQVLFRTPPRRRRRHRNRSDINPHEVPKQKQEAIAFRTMVDDETPTRRRPGRKGADGRRRFIPSWPFDPMSLVDSRDIGDLDKAAIQAALDAQRELQEESLRIGDMEMLEDVDFSGPGLTDNVTEEMTSPREKAAEVVVTPRTEVISQPVRKERTKIALKTHETEEPPKPRGRQVIKSPPSNYKVETYVAQKTHEMEEPPTPRGRQIIISPPYEYEVEAYVAIRSRSPSSSPRMVGEAFIPGVPDFVQSVVPNQLETPSVSDDSEPSTPAPKVKAAKPTHVSQATQAELEAMKFPKPIMKFSASKEEKESIDYRYSPPFEDKKPQPPVMVFRGSDDKVASSDPAPMSTSSGRSTPQSGGANSQSETSGSSNSKSSASTSSFPRFVHSVFPLRRSSSTDRRGRSKTRRKREKKQKHKNKKRSKSSTKSDTENKMVLPKIEVTSPPHTADSAEQCFLPSPPHYATVSQGGSPGAPVAMYFPSAAKVNGTANGINSSQQAPTNGKESPRSRYDQESIDKIVLSESDDAHSAGGTPITVRRADGYKEADTPRSDDASTQMN